jgi:hypothetical protein
MERGHWDSGFFAPEGRDYDDSMFHMRFLVCRRCDYSDCPLFELVIFKKNARQSSGRADSFEDYFEKAVDEVEFDSVFISLDARRRQGLPDGPRDCGCRVLLQMLAQSAVLGELPGKTTKKSYPDLTWPRLMLPRKASPKENSQQPG